MLPSLCLISPKQTVSSSQSLSCSTGLKVIVAQVKTPKRGCRLLRLPVVDNPQIMAHMLSSPWLSVYSSGGSPAGTSLGWGGSDPLKVCWKGQSRILSPLKMIHSFIWNCCITASFTDSRMNSWILSLHWSCLCWRCYCPYVWSAPSRQCPPINAFATTWLKVIYVLHVDNGTT